MNKEKALLVRPAKSLDFEKKKACIKADLVDIIKDSYKHQDLNALRLDTAFLKEVCNILEAGIEKSNSKKYKIDKKQIVLDALEILIPTLTSPEMKAIISKNIESLHDEGLITGVTQTAYLGFKTYKYLSKFIL